ncbi:SPOR domain-containing protein [Haliea sp.]|uniref:SPOR domain-containing protein n=1 Tax=Haliea TaxID=475794 RepID=UPI000C4E94C2|nr:SPOR domain-containing protein [Haliea sp.]MAY91442.1 hypothetical protein [Haliea sp.]MBK41024.1 hypothetical protein [Haliea sp.]MBP71044.1 hypothetical protein [Haliea sp.]
MTAGQKLSWALFASTLVIGGLVYGYLVQQREALRAEFIVLEQRRADVVSREDLLLQERLARVVADGNARLERDLEQLRDENRELSAMIEQLEAGLAQRGSVVGSSASADTAEAANTADAGVTREPVRTEPEVSAPPQGLDEATPAAESGGAWFVNFGSYVQRAIAERWAQRLERDGGNAVAGRVVIQPATVSGQDLFRVRVTGLESQQQARGIAATLEARYGLARLWVGRSERG